MDFVDGNASFIWRVDRRRHNPAAVTTGPLSQHSDFPRACGSHAIFRLLFVLCLLEWLCFWWLKSKNPSWGVLAWYSWFFLARVLKRGQKEEGTERGAKHSDKDRERRSPLIYTISLPSTQFIRCFREFLKEGVLTLSHLQRGYGDRYND